MPTKIGWARCSELDIYNMAYVYRHIRLDKNEPFYIGIGKDSGGKHSRANRKSQRSDLWNKIVNKTDYRIEILEDDLTYDEAKEKEIWWINLYGRLDKKTGTLANHTDGGEGTTGLVVSEETRNHLSKVRKGKCFRKPGWKMSEEQKKKLSWERMGNVPTNKGVPATDEIKRKISEAKKGKPSHLRKKVICVETGEIFPSIEHAERDQRFYKGGVSKVLEGKRKSLRGFTFRYFDGNAADISETAQ